MASMPRPGTGARTKQAAGQVGWWPAFVIAAVSLVDRVETSVLTGVLPALQTEWGFSDTAGGAIPTAVTIAGLLVALPAGYLADRADRTRLLAIVVASWSVITLASGLAISFAMFFATRVVLGAADNLDIPSQSSLLGDYYPPEARPKVFGIQRMVYFAGIGVGSLLGGILAEVIGWRWAFFSMILPGLLVAWWCHRLTEPQRGAADRAAASRRPATTASHAAPESPVPDGPDGAPLPEPGAELSAPHPPANPLDAGWRPLLRQIREIFRIRTLLFLYGGMVVLFLSLNGIFFWLPTYFVRTFDIGTGLGGTLTAVVTMVGVVTGTAIGAVIGRRWHGRVEGGRVVAGALGFLGGGVLMGAGFISPTLTSQVTLITAATASMSIAIPNHFAAAADCIAARNRGVGFTFTQIGTATGSSFGPLVVGMVSDRTGSLEISFYTLVVPILIAGLVVLGGRNTYEDDAAQVLADSLEG